MKEAKVERKKKEKSDRIGFTSTMNWNVPTGSWSDALMVRNVCEQSLSLQPSHPFRLIQYTGRTASATKV
jgi:hypothetical protein